MPYTYATLADLINAVAVRLTDPDNVFWARPELTIYVNDALKVWNSIARCFRDRGSFLTDSGTQFYDLATVLRNGSGEAFMARSVTQAQLVTQLKYMLMEPNPEDQTSFSDQFTLADLTDALNDSTNQFLLETGCAISLPADQLVPAGDGRIALTDENIIDIVRAQWQRQDGYINIMVREDDFSAGHFTPRWPQAPGTPRRFSIFPSPLLTVQLLPPPIDTGTLQLQVIAAGSLPDDFTPYILQASLAELLGKSGPARDPARARYSDQRWKEGVAAGKQVASVLQSFINNRPVSTGPLFNADHFQPSWINRQGVPTNIGLLGQNVAAPYPAASDEYQITMDAVRNAPVLVNDDDLVPLGKEYLDLLVNYIAHLAVFKCGYAEFSYTFPAYEAFVQAAVEYNNRMSGQTLHFEFMNRRDQAQGEREPKRLEANS